MTRSGNRGLRPYLAAVAAVFVLVAGLLALPIGANAQGSSGPTWSVLSPPGRPPALAFAAEAYDPANQTTVLFGGVDASGALSNATWVWNGTTWNEASAQLSSPSPRELASLAYFPGAAGQTQGQLILFGGEGAGGNPLGDTWAWNGRSWVEMASSPNGPAPRFGASLAGDAIGDLVLFGGTGSTHLGQGPMNAAPPTVAPRTSPGVSAASANVNGPLAGVPGPGATPVAAASSTTTTPAPTSGVTPPSGLTNSPANGLTTLNDTWVWNGTAWSQPNITAEPSARTDASLVWDPTIGQTVLFGGSATPTARGSATPLGDTWVWSGSAWTQVTPPSAPPPRYDAAGGSAGVLGGDLVVGGNNGSGQFSDLWNFTGETWLPLVANGAITARYGAAAAGNPASGTLMVFGGLGPGGNLDDTDVLTAAPPVQVTPTPGGSSGTAPGGSSPTGSSPSTPTPSNPGPPGTAGASPSSTVNPTHPASGPSAPTSHRGSTPTSATRPASTTVPATSPSTLAQGSPVGISASGQPAVGSQANLTPQPTGHQPGLTTSPPLQTVHTGSLVTVLGSGFKPGAMVTITFHSRPYTIGRTRAGPNGTFSATVTVPLNASPGHHHLEASGMGPHGRLTVLLTPLMVLASLTQPASGTPRTTTIVMVSISVLLPIATWLVLGAWSRRRRRPTAVP